MNMISVAVDAIRKFMVCFSIDIMEKQSISFQKLECMLVAQKEQCTSIINS